MFLRKDLPENFRDRPWYKRIQYHVEILLRRRSIKTECCKSYEDKEFCCKGCAKIYCPTAPNTLHRLLYKISKKI